MPDILITRPSRLQRRYMVSRTPKGQKFIETNFQYEGEGDTVHVCFDAEHTEDIIAKLKEEELEVDIE